MKVLTKVAIGIAAAGIGGLLFVRSVKQSQAEPYTVDPRHLTGWRLTLGDASTPSDPVLMLRGPDGLVPGLSNQIFKRVMESLSSPAGAFVALLTKREFESALGGRVTSDQVVAAAHQAGLGGKPLVVRCLAWRRSSDPGATRQAYFLIADMPEFTRFRQALANLARAGAGAGGGGAPVPFDPAALSPVVFVAFSQSMVTHWMPLAADPERDCVAPLAMSTSTSGSP